MSVIAHENIRHFYRSQPKSCNDFALHADSRNSREVIILLLQYVHAQQRMLDCGEKLRCDDEFSEPRTLNDISFLPRQKPQMFRHNPSYLRLIYFERV
jgi:hypothetical protein